MAETEEGLYQWVLQKYKEEYCCCVYWEVF